MAEKVLYIAFVVILYWVISISTVFVNKALLSSKDINLDAPLFVTWYQCFISTTICVVLSMLSRLFPDKIQFPEGNPFNVDNMKIVLPLSILFVGMISFNNLCLKYVDVSFYFIGRSLTTVFNVVFSYLILGQKTSFQILVCCSVILAGFWLGVDQENISGSLSTYGTIFGVLGSLSLSLYTIYTKRVLPFVNQEIWLLSYYNNAYSCILFVPIIIMNGEIPVVLNYEKFSEIYFWSLMTVGGLFGFAIGFVTSLQIKVTSPLTHNISGTAKACAQTIIASHWDQAQKSYLWWISNFIVLGGSATYAYIRQNEMKKKKNLHKLSQNL